jgi:hypothetical protein
LALPDFNSISHAAQAAMFDHPIFDKAAGSKGGLAGSVLVVRQESGASVQLDALVDWFASCRHRA